MISSKYKFSNINKISMYVATHDRGTVVLYVYVNYAVSMYVRIW